MDVKYAVILDAGVSSRFLPVVKTIPKSFLPIGGKPIIQLLIEEVLEAKIDNIIVVARKETFPYFQDYFENPREDLREFLNKMNKSERYKAVEQVLKLPKIKVITQDTELPYGTAAPILSAKPFLPQGEPFLVLQGDDIVFAEKKDCQILVEEYKKDNTYSAYMTAEEVSSDRIHLYGAIKFKEGSNNELDYIIEKPDKEDAPSFLASYGRFLYKAEIFDYMNDKRLGKDNELWNVDALTAMAKEKRVKVVPNQGRWFTTGDPKNYMKALMFAGLVNTETSSEMMEFVKELI